jgi:hypothetical protein
MRKLIFLSALLPIGLAACVTTPPLEEATGRADSPIMIKDVVQRVKCELSDAFNKKTEDPNFLWLASWTAKVDLTLTINDTAGITPSGSFTSFQHNAVNFDAGPSTFPAGQARSVVNQFFTFGAAANLNAQAVRTETVSFTVALDELKLWRRQLDRVENHPNFPDEKRICNFAGQTGITGSLGLKEWVDSAFYPVTAGELEAGIHPPPLSQKAGNVPSASEGPPRLRGAAVPHRLSFEEIRQGILESRAKLRTIKTSMEVSKQTIDGSAQLIKSSSSSLESKIISIRNTAPQYKYVLQNYLKKRFKMFGLYRQAMSRYAENSEECAKRVSGDIITEVGKAITDADNTYNKLSGELAAGSSSPSDELVTLYRDLERKTEEILRKRYDENAKACAQILSKDADSAAALTASIPDQIDPPVDSILHSVQFVVTYGASISPSWTLLQWKGPALNQSLVGGTGIRTHNVQIALGPRNGKSSASEDALRLIQNQTVQGLRN